MLRLWISLLLVLVAVSVQADPEKLSRKDGSTFAFDPETYLYQGAASPSNNAVPRITDGLIASCPGMTCDDTGVMSGNGFRSATDPASARFFYVSTTASTAEQCATLYGTAAVDYTSGSGGKSVQMNLPMPDDQPATMLRLTISLWSFVTDANFGAGEIVSFHLVASTLNTGIASATQIDQFVFENAASPATTYGVGSARTAIACTSRPCQHTFTIDGLGLSSAGDPSFTAGQYKWVGICSVNTTLWTADVDGTDPDAGDPGAFNATFDLDYVR